MPLGVSFSFGDDMKDLHELAQEYLKNAENLKVQILEKKKQLNNSATQEQFKLRHEISMLEQMYYEQMTTYYQLENYYKK